MVEINFLSFCYTFWIPCLKTWKPSKNCFIKKSSVWNCTEFLWKLWHDNTPFFTENTSGEKYYHCHFIKDEQNTFGLLNSKPKSPQMINDTKFEEIQQQLEKIIAKQMKNKATSTCGH